MRPLSTEETLLKFEFERLLEDLQQGQISPDTIFQWDKTLGKIPISKKRIELQLGGGGNRKDVVPPIRPPPRQLPSPVVPVSKKVVKLGGAQAGNPAPEENDSECDNEERRCASRIGSTDPPRKRGGGEEQPTIRQEEQMLELPSWLQEKGKIWKISSPI